MLCRMKKGFAGVHLGADDHAECSNDFSTRCRRTLPSRSGLLGSRAVPFFCLMWEELVNNQHELPSFMRDWVLFITFIFPFVSCQSANFVSTFLVPVDLGRTQLPSV